MGPQWTWYVLAAVGAYQLTVAGLDALVRRVVRIASQASTELPSMPFSATAMTPEPESVPPRPKPGRTRPGPTGHEGGV